MNYIRQFGLFSLILIAVFAVNCGSAGESANTNTGINVSNHANSNGFRPVDNANLPEGLNPVPIQPSGTATPGIPDPANAANAVVKGATPTLGIPDPKNGNRQLKPGATPTPGIPDEETLRKMLKQPTGNVNTPPPPPSGESMMKKRKLPGNRQ